MKALERLLRAATSLARSLRGSAPFRRGSVTVWEATGEPGQHRISEIRDSRADRLALRDIVEELSSFPEWTTAEALLTALVDERKIEPPGIVRPGVAGAYLEPLILSYFDRLSNVRWQPQAASATVRGLLHHFQEETTPVRRLLVLGGFSAARTFRIDSEIRFRPISEADILSITRDRSHGGPSVAFPLSPESTDGLGCAGCRARNGRFGGCGSGWWRWQGATVAVRACGQEETAVGRRSQACWRQAVERSARPSGVRSGAGSLAAGRGRR